MEEIPPEKPTMRFLSFANNEEDAEKEAKLKEAAARIEQAMSKEKVLSELVDYKEAHSSEQQIDPANDTRSLYERLQEQKNKKMGDIEESQKLSNWITTLDDDDVEYLNEVAKKKREDELRRRLEMQDALEAKKRLDEQKMLDEERRIKESLLGKSPQTVKNLSNKSRISSLIKMKPKIKSNDHQTHSTTTVVEESFEIKQQSATIVIDSDSVNRDQPQNDRAIDSSANSLDNTQNQIENEKQNQVTQDSPKCTCPKDVMTSIGVLPSLPIITNARDSSERDSDYSDDDLYGRLVPRSRKRRK